MDDVFYNGVFFVILGLKDFISFYFKVISFVVCFVVMVVGMIIDVGFFIIL